MFRRVQDILSRINQRRWRLENPSEPPCWSNLPVEMRREIVKYTDIMDRFHLRRCSKMDRDIVDSLPLKVALARVQSEKNILSVTIVESPDKVLRVDVKRKKFRLKKRNTVLISRNVFGLEPVELHPNYDLNVILHSLFSIVAHKFMAVATLNVTFEEPNDVLQEVLHEMYLAGSLQKSQVICSGITFLAFGVQFLKVKEARLFHETFPYEADIMRLFAGRNFVLDPMGYANFNILFTKSSILNGNLGALIANIMVSMNTPTQFFMLPGYEEREPEELCQRYSGQYALFPNNVHTMSIPNPQDATRKLVVKVSRCGAYILKVNTNELPENMKNYEDKTCGLSWLCDNCDKSTESWYFRQLSRPKGPHRFEI